MNPAAGYFLAALIALLYLARLNADTISGLFGIYWMDEGVYLLAAKNYALFGTAHFLTNDGWLPELKVPLIHYLSLATMWGSDPLFAVRIVVCMCVLASAFIFAWIARKHYASTAHGIACFLTILLNPVLFFYARLGLSEGVQFLIVAIIIALLYKLYSTAQSKHGLMLSAAVCTLIALLFASKITSVAACASLGIGWLLILEFNPTLPRNRHAVCGATIGIIACVVFFLIFTRGELHDWWRLNMQYQEGIGQTPNSLSFALQVFFYKIPSLAYYLCLMPIFALYYLSLIAASERKKDFVFILAAITLSMLVLESFWGPTVRRNFFGLTMLGVLFGFVSLDYLKSGVHFKTWNPLKIAAAAFLALQVVGILFLFYVCIQRADRLYWVLVPVFLLIIAAGMFARGEKYQRSRQLLLALLATCSIIVMGLQSFFMPHTRKQADAAIEERLPENAVIAGVRAPVYFQGARRVVLTNCAPPNVLPVAYGNDIDEVARKVPIYYLTHARADSDPCTPLDIRKYKSIATFDIFDPQNPGIELSTSNQWTYKRHLTLYEKQP